MALQGEGTRYQSVEDQGAAVQVSASVNQCYLKFIGVFAISAIFNDLILLPMLTILIFYELAFRHTDDIMSICDCSSDNWEDTCNVDYCDCTHYDEYADYDVTIWFMAWMYDFIAICCGALCIFVMICATSMNMNEVFGTFIKIRMNEWVYIATMLLRLIAVICAFAFIANYPPTSCSCDDPCKTNMTFNWNAYVDTLGALMRIYIVCGIFFLCTKRCLLILIRNIKIDVSMQYLRWHYIRVEAVQ